MSPGDMVAGRYEIIELIGRGGMGAVYRARHAISERVVALKLMYAIAQDEASIRRFGREASAHSRIGHEGIVEVLDAGVDPDNGVLFLAMELLEGESLRERLTRRGLTLREALLLVDALLEPLAAAHEHGFVHRDLKPENVFVARGADGAERVKLLDFGIAREMGSASQTQTGTSLGTPHYMAPEQAMSAKGVTPAADVWSVGVILYEILAGRPPFTGETPHAVVVRACTEAHEPIANVVPAISPEAAELIERCLHKDPAARMQDAAMVREQLRLALDAPFDSGAPILAWRPPPPDQARTHPTSIPATRATASAAAPKRPRRALFVGLGIAALVGSAALAWGLFGAETEGDPTSDAPSFGEPSQTQLQTIRGVGWTFQVPASWEEKETHHPSVVAAVTSTEDVPIPINAKLVVEPYDGTLTSYVSLAFGAIGDVSTVHRTGEITMSSHPGMEIEVTFHAADPPYRELVHVTVVDGTGYVFHCFGPPDDFDAARVACRSVLRSLRISE